MTRCTRHHQNRAFIFNIYRKGRRLKLCAVSSNKMKLLTHFGILGIKKLERLCAFLFFFSFFYMDIDVKLWGDTSPIENLLREDKNQVAIHERNLISKAPKCRTIGFFCVVCSVIEGRTVCCRVGRECILLFSDYFFFVLCF